MKTRVYGESPLTTKSPTTHITISHTSQETPQSPPVTKALRLHRPGCSPHPSSCTQVPSTLAKQNPSKSEEELLFDVISAVEMAEHVRIANFQLFLPIPPYISLYLLISPYISLYLPVSPYISLHLPISPRWRSCATRSPS